MISGKGQIPSGIFDSRLRVVITLFLIFPFRLYAQSTVQAVLIQNPPQIDGYLAPGEWVQAAIIDSFTQREPQTGAPVSERTEFYICYDPDNLYIAARCYDRPELISAQQLERDASLGNDDKIVVILDTFLDQRNAFWFQMNALGCIGDALLSENGASLNKQWDGLWTGKAGIHQSGWDVELKIPFKSLAFDPGSSTWGLKLEREIQRKVEKSYWPVANVNSYKFQVSDAGLLVGLEGIRQGIGLDLRPYGLAGFDKNKSEAEKFDGDLGLDVFYQITPAIKSALTINTDFAQTEVDDKQINLTRFPLFYPEKRDFFLDGASYFQFGREGDQDNPYAQRLIVFFSRRLGLDNTRNPIPILGGMKITGQHGNWNLGALDVMDEREDGYRNFAVARISRNVGSQSRIGMIATGGDASAARDNVVLGLDLKLATATFSGNKNLALLVYGLKSKTAGISARDHAFGAEVNFPNDLLYFRAGYSQIDKNFNAGIGFIPRKDIKNTYLQASLNPRPQAWGILQLYFSGTLDYITDMSNRLLTREISIKPLGIRFNSGDEIKIQAAHHFEYLSRPDTISSIEISAGTYKFWQYSAQLATAQRRNLWAVFTYTWGTFYNGERRTTGLQSGYKIAVPLFLGFDLEYTDGTLSQTAFTREVYRFKADILFSPEVVLNNFIQYDNYSKQMGWQSRFRWIISPGDELNLVWNSISADPFERFEITESAARIKIQYNYRF